MLLGPPLAAQGVPDLEVRIARDQTPRVLPSELYIGLTVSLLDRATHQPPPDRFPVFVYATSASGERTDTYPCGLIRDNDPEAPPGAYSCTVIVDHGGQWEFVAVANQPGRDRNRAPVIAGRGSAQFDIVGGTLAKTDTSAAASLDGKASEVLILWGHTVAAVGWFTGVAVLILLAVPGARRHLSAAAQHRLEGHLDVVVKGTVTATALTVGSGSYLLLKMTPYETPLSAAAARGVFTLPYGKPYLLSLAVKLALYGLMIGAIVPLTRQAQRRRRASASPNGSPPCQADIAAARSAVWGAGSAAPARRGVASRVRERAPAVAPPGEPERVDGPAPLGARVGALTVAAGGTGIWLCVTLLKYFHELIEAAR